MAVLDLVNVALMGESWLTCASSVAPDQRPFRDQRASHPPRDGRPDRATVQAQLRQRDRGLRIGDIGLRLAQGGERRLVLLCADRLALHQRTEPLGDRARILLHGLRALQHGIGLRQLRLVVARFDLE